MEKSEFEEKIREYIKKNLSVVIDSQGGFGWAEIRVSLLLNGEKIKTDTTQFWYK